MRLGISSWKVPMKRLRIVYGIIRDAFHSFIF